MNYKIVKTRLDFANLKEDWEQIEKLSNGLTFHSTFFYNFQWYDTFYSRELFNLFIIIIYNNEKVIGIAPLKIQKQKRKFYTSDTLVFLVSGDYLDLVIDISSEVSSRNIIKEIFKAIEENQHEFDEIWLTHINQHSYLAHFLLTSKNNKNLIYLTENPFIDFSKFESFDTYRKTFSPKKTHQYINRIKRELNYKMLIKLDNVIDDISKIHIKEKQYLHSKGEFNRHSLFEDPKIFFFLNKIYSSNNVLTYLLVDVENKDEIICFYSGYIYKNVFHSGITAYNPKYQKLSVGKIFNYLIFEQNMKEPLWKLFDMGTGRYAWKFEMTNTFNLLYQFRVFKPRNGRIKFLDKLEKFLLALSQFLRV